MAASDQPAVRPPARLRIPAAVPWNQPWSPASGSPICRSVRWMRFDRLAERDAGRKVERHRHGGELPLMRDRSAARACRSIRAKADSGTAAQPAEGTADAAVCWSMLRPASRRDVDLAECRDRPQRRLDLEHHVILVHRPEDGGDLALAERVIQRLVDRRAW